MMQRTHRPRIRTPTESMLLFHCRAEPLGVADILLIFASAEMNCPSINSRGTCRFHHASNLALYRRLIKIRSVAIYCVAHVLEKIIFNGHFHAHVLSLQRRDFSLLYMAALSF
jgi:hypothetical protein